MNVDEYSRIKNAAETANSRILHTWLTADSANRAVLIVANGMCFYARLYTNCREGIENATPCGQHGAFKTEAGARRWAARQLEICASR